MGEPSERTLARRRQAARRVRHLRGLRPPGGREPHLPGPLRAPAPGAGVGRDRGDRRALAARREGDGVGGRRVLARAPPAAAGPGGDGPCPLLDRRLLHAPERAAHQRLVLAGPDRARPQRQPGQRRHAPHGAGAPRRHLPVDFRLGGDPPPHRAGRPQQPGAHADPGARPGQRRLLRRHAHPGHAGRMSRPPRLPSARDRTAGPDLAPGLRDLRPRPPRGRVRARRRAGRDRADRPERPALDQAVPAEEAAPVRLRVRLLRAARHVALGPERATRPARRSATGWPRSTPWRPTS